MTLPKSIKAIDLCVIVILFFLCIFLFRNINFYHVPNTDVFQFIEDGIEYLNGKLPSNIHAPPANPILLSLIAKLLPTEYPEIHAAIGLNIIFAILTAFLIFKIGQVYLGKYGLLLFLLTVTNPLFYLVSLNTTSEVWFTFNLVFIIFLHLRGHYRLPYLLAGLSFLVRYESIILIPLLFLVDSCSRHLKKITVRYVLVGLSIIAFWLWVISIKNPAGSLKGNEFWREIQTRKSMLPMTMLHDYYLPRQFLNDPNLDIAATKKLLVLSTFFGLCCFIKYSKYKKDVFLITLISLSYALIHLFFPASADRYSYPILWVIYLFNLWPILLFQNLKLKINRQSAIRLITLILCLPYLYICYRNATAIIPYLNASNTTGLENRLVADWLNQHYQNKSAVIISLEPWITKYYTKNPRLVFAVSSPYCYACIDGCLSLKKYGVFPPYDLLVVRDSYTDSADENNFMAQNFGVKFFQTFKSSIPPPDYQLITRLERENNWAMIYKYETNPPLNPQ